MPAPEDARGIGIGVERRGRVTILTIDRPAARNALDPASQHALGTALDAFEADDGQWVAILTGAGDIAFSAGHDLKGPIPAGPEEMPPGGFGGITARFAMTKPIIAAVNGLAYGGGFEMALACDIVVAVAHARFALPEVRVGLAALGGGTLRLPQAIGLKRAMALLLTGRPMHAGEALAAGLVSEVVEADVLGAALRWADAILACSPMAVRATKQAVLHGLSAPIEVAMTAQWQLPAVARLLASEDREEGTRAFREKRPPDWPGR